MENRKICYKCLLEDFDEKKAYNTVKELIDSIQPEKRTGEEEYRKRLNICRACDSLISGTCVKCGCYVELRAAGLSGRCPDVRNKWE